MWRRFMRNTKQCAPDMIFERLEERIVLDGAAEAVEDCSSAPVDSAPTVTPGLGLFDGAVHRSGGELFVYDDGKGWWWFDDGSGPDYQFAFDYETGQWYENDGGWYLFASKGDFQEWAEAGLCPFDGTGHRIGEIGGDPANPLCYLYYEGKGWWWFDDGAGAGYQFAYDYTEYRWWVNDGVRMRSSWSEFGDPGASSEFVYDGEWRRCGDGWYVYTLDKGWWWHGGEFTSAHDYRTGEWWAFEDGQWLEPADREISWALGAEVTWLTPVGCDLYFASSSDADGVTLRRLDTLSGDVEDLGAGGSAPRFESLAWVTPFAGDLYFAADDGISGDELWKYDADRDSFELIGDINPDAGDSEPAWLTVFERQLYFSADDGERGHELWKYDPVSQAPEFVAEINNGGDDGLKPRGLHVRNLTPFDGDLYFGANDGSRGTELWKYDPETDRALMVKDIYPGFFYFPGAPGPPVPKSSSPYWLTVVGDELFFTARGGDEGYELWKYDPAADAAELVRDVIEGSSSSNPSFLTEMGGDLYFSGSSPNTGSGLWRYDPASDAVELIREYDPRPYTENPAYLTALSGDLYFGDNDEVSGGSLRIYDPETDTESLVGVVTSSPGRTGPNCLAACVGRLYFAVYSDTDGWGIGVL